MVTPVRAAEPAQVGADGQSDGPPGRPGAILIVGVDGTPTGDAALAWALDEAELRHASVEVVVARTIETAATAQVGLDDLSDDLCRELLARALERVGGAHDLPVDLAIEADEPFREMAYQASARQATMTVIGNHPHRRSHDLVHGLPTSLLGRRGHCPLVVVPVGFVRRPRGHLVVGTTTSARTLAALRWAAEEAALLDGTVRAVHVVPAGPSAGDGAVRSRGVQRALRQTHRLTDLTTTFGIAITVRVATGPVPAVLVAEATTAELLVLGAPEHLGLAELVRHTVLRQVLATCHVPVVVVPGPA